MSDLGNPKDPVQTPTALRHLPIALTPRIRYLWQLAISLALPAIFAVMLASQIASAHAKAPPKGPFERKTEIKAARTAALWIDHLSIGSVQTAVGLGHLVVALISEPIATGQLPGLTVSNGNQGKLLTIQMTPPVAGTAYSLGGFSIGDGTRYLDGRPIGFHESGHTDLSSALGPLYAPFVLLDYLVEGNPGAAMVEGFANLDTDTWNDYSTTGVAQMGGGFLKSPENGKVTPYVVFSFAIDERTSREDTNVKIKKIYEWVNTKILLPAAIRDQTKAIEIPFETELLHKKQVLIGSFSRVKGPEWLQFQIVSDTDYGKFTSPAATGDFRYDALKWAPTMGLSLKFGPTTTYLVGGGSFGLSGRFSLEKEIPDHPVGFQGEASIEGGIELYDYATLFARHQWKWFVDSSDDSIKESATTIGLTNRMRSPENELPAWANYIDFSAEFTQETIQDIKGQDHDIERFEFLLGGRF